MSDLTASTAPGARTLGLLRRRLRGSYDIDDWGLDPELIALAEPFVGARWEVEVDGAHRIPGTGGALLVYNRQVGLSEPWVLAHGVRRTAGRFVRTVGLLDVAPLGPLLRRFGAVVDRDDEVEGLLRAGQVVAVPLSRRVEPGRPGSLDPRRIAAARRAGVPVLPVALVGHEATRRWRVVVGDPIAEAAPPPRGRRARRAAGRSAAGVDVDAPEVATAAAAATAVGRILDDAVPATWWQ